MQTVVKEKDDFKFRFEQAEMSIILLNKELESALMSKELGHKEADQALMAK